MEGRVFENFQKNQNSFKIPKCPKSSAKVSKRKFSKSKKTSKFQKSPKLFPKVSKRVLNKFRVNLFEKKLCPVFEEGSSLRKFSKKSKKFQNSKKAQNRSQKCPNVFWRCFRVIFSKFCPVFHGGSSLRKFSKKIKKFSKFQKCPKPSPKVSERKFSKNLKKFQNSKNAQNRPQKCPNVFWRCFRVIPSKNVFAQCSMEGRVFENFQKNQKISKIPKMPKIVPKSVQTCFEDVLGWFFQKKFLPSVPWRVKSSKIFKKIEKVSKFQKCPKSSPKVSKRKFSKKIKKVSKFQKCPKSFQKCPNVFWTCFGVIFSKKFFAQCSKEGRVIENFQKNQKIFKIPKMPKIVPKSVQTCFEDVLGWFFWKFFLPSVPWRVESSNFFKKIKKFSKFKKGPNSFPKVSKRVLKMF